MPGGGLAPGDLGAKALMAQPQRSQRVVIALALAGRGADLRDAQFRNAYDRIAGEPEGIRFGLRDAFRVYLDIKPLRFAPKPRLPRVERAALKRATGSEVIVVVGQRVARPVRKALLVSGIDASSCCESIHQFSVDPAHP